MISILEQPPRTCASVLFCTYLNNFHDFNDDEQTTAILYDTNSIMFDTSQPKQLIS